MPHSISTLLIRILRDVFGENDPAPRRAAMEEIYTEDVVFYDPNRGVYRDHDETGRCAEFDLRNHAPQAVGIRSRKTPPRPHDTQRVFPLERTRYLAPNSGVKRIEEQDLGLTGEERSCI